MDEKKYEFYKKYKDSLESMGFHMIDVRKLKNVKKLYSKQQYEDLVEFCNKEMK